MTLEIQGVAGDKHNTVAELNWLMYICIDKIKHTNSRQHSYSMTKFLALALSQTFGIPI